MVQLFRRQRAVLTATSLSPPQCTLTFSDMERLTTKLNLIHNVNMDELYDECSTAKPTLKKLKEEAEVECQVADLPNILSITDHILSIPASTGYVKRTFYLTAGTGATRSS